MEEELKRYKVIKKYSVQWGHMDSARHVNNTVYLRWAESARIAYFEAMDMDTSFEGGGIGPILGWQDCKYIFPLTFPDVAIVGARIIEQREDRFIMECAIYSETHQRISAISKQSIIPYSYGELKKVALPQEWVDAIKHVDA